VFEVKLLQIDADSVVNLGMMSDLLDITSSWTVTRDKTRYQQVLKGISQFISCLNPILTIVLYNRKDKSQIEREIPSEDSEGSSDIKEIILGLAVDLTEGKMMFCSSKCSSKISGEESKGGWTEVFSGKNEPKLINKGHRRKFFPYFHIEGKSPVKVSFLHDSFFQL
jgi:hypothetical protein